MDFELMFCPYCGGDVDSSNESVYLCKSCGKNIYTDREGVRHFIRPGELEASFNEAVDAIEDDNPKKALSIADELLKASDETDFDAYFLRGAAYASEGEDGKAFNDWKKGLEILTVYTNIDAYVCLMTRYVSGMIYEKESEFIDFNATKYIDKLCDEIYACTNESCKAFLYYNIYIAYRRILGINDANSDESLNEVVPKLFVKAVAYHRNCLCMSRIIDEYLASIGYDPETYDDDDLEAAHVLDLVSRALGKYTEGMDADGMRRVMGQWDDASLKLNEERLEAMMPHKDGVLGKLLSRKSEAAPVDLEAAADAFVREYLRLDDPAKGSEEPQVLE